MKIESLVNMPQDNLEQNAASINRAIIKISKIKIYENIWEKKLLIFTSKKIFI